MTSSDRSDLVDRARSLLEEARAAEDALDSAAAMMFRLGGDVARADTRSRAARSGAHVAAERDLVGGLLDELGSITLAADRLGQEISRATDGAAAGADRGAAEARAELRSVRRIVQAAGGRARECVWMGELAATRVREFAEFELLYSQASRHLDDDELDAADAALPRLIALDRALLSGEVGAMLDELKFRTMTSRG
ncbi:hypothetical protein [Dietzia sp. ANT_WB102]|uniref:hypothetical protein n=1 Tax=Dietzia sp. ANT_WB102 TaxID=2597345 RepID=UPI0011ECE65C|nr:hypothetical protein [Dietzia sp. ANT_WB102]KAA0918771.1 hypothetical protein FQ137_05460 [Dietzia sp. ANT_WB102]